MPTVPSSFGPMIDEYMRQTGQSVTVAESAVTPEMVSKYRNKKTEIDGRVFASKKEANRYLDLREQQRAGLIRELQCQVALPLFVNEVEIGEYVCDFSYFRGSNERVIEDVKSEVTRKLPVYRLKRKILAANGIVITEI